VNTKFLSGYLKGRGQVADRSVPTDISKWGLEKYGDRVVTGLGPTAGLCKNSYENWLPSLLGISKTIMKIGFLKFWEFLDQLSVKVHERLRHEVSVWKNFSAILYLSLDTTKGSTLLPPLHTTVTLAGPSVVPTPTRGTTKQLVPLCSIPVKSGVRHQLPLGFSWLSSVPLS